MTLSLILLPYVASALVSLALAVYGYRHRTVAAALPFIAYAIGQALWSQGYICELLSTSLDAKIAWDSYQFIGTFTVTIAVWSIARQYTRQSSVFEGRHLAKLLMIPVFVTFAALTEPFHQFLRKSARIIPGKPVGSRWYDFTIVDYLGIAFVYGVSFAAVFMLVRHYRHGNYLVRRQTFVLTVGIAIPLFLGSFFFLVYNPFTQRDPMPFVFLLGGLVQGYGLFRVRLFDVLPIAREALFEEITIGVLVIDVNGRIVDINSAASSLLGVTESTTVGRLLRDVSTPFKLTLPDNDCTKSLTKFATLPNEYLWLETTTKALNGVDQLPCGFIVMLRDVTEAKRRELDLEAARETLEEKVLERTTELRAEIEQRQRVNAALVASENRFRAIFNQSFQFFGILACDGILLDANESALDLIGCSRRDVIGRPFWETPWWSDSEEQAAQLQAAINAAAAGSFVRFEATHRSRTQELRDIDFSLKPVRDDQNRVVLIVPEGRDVTEFKRSEKDRQSLALKLQQAERLEALGRLASGISHDFNNLLTVIVGDLAYLQEFVSNEPELSNTVLNALEATQRASTLTRQLLTFSRRQVVEPKVFDPSENLFQLKRMLDRVLGESVTLELDVASDASMLFMDPSQFEQIIVNLAVNARDAMPNGGVLKITLSLEPPKPPTDNSPEVDSVIRLTVTDTGEGIDETVLPHIFEPFFTTKGPNAGTGLGLATVHGIVTQASGNIVVDSTKGRGTRVSITLPCCSMKPTTTTTETISPPSQRSNYRVLVVEDQDSVRQLVTRSLQRFGFAPIAYANAQSALEFADTNGNAFDVVLTDVVMPGMNGRTLADELRRRYPSLPIVFMSGHVDDGVLRQGVERHQEHYIAKPFSPNELAHKLRSVLRST